MTYPLQKQLIDNTAQARLNMVNGQLLTNGIHNRGLLAAYRDTPREAYMPPASAYLDEDIKIAGTNRFVLEPLTEARLLSLALETPLANVLVLGAASLPSVVMLAQFAHTMTVLEPDHATAQKASKAMHNPNILVVSTDYRKGYPKHAHYDAILTTGAMSRFSEEIAAQLTINGRWVSVVQENQQTTGKITVLHRLSEDGFSATASFDSSTPYLAGFEPEKGFAFT